MAGKRYRLSIEEEKELLDKRNKQLQEKMTIEPTIKVNNNVLIISDLHIPFEHKDALKHCKKVYRKYKCNKVVFIGDIIDNHYSSYHEQNPDGMSAGDELDKAIFKIRPWYRAFPEATVIIGNHDRIIMRKAFSNDLSKRWIKDFKDVLETPNWNFVEEYELDGVKYIHGEGAGSTLQTILQSQQRVVWGHYHTKFEVMYSKDGLWGMNVGCLIDRDKYAFAYAKAQVKEQLIGCGVVLNNGELPILLPLLKK